MPKIFEKYPELLIIPIGLVIIGCMILAFSLLFKPTTISETISEPMAVGADSAIGGDGSKEKVNLSAAKVNRAVEIENNFKTKKGFIKNNTVDEYAELEALVKEKISLNGGKVSFKNCFDTAGQFKIQCFFDYLKN